MVTHLVILEPPRKIRAFTVVLALVLQITFKSANEFGAAGKAVTIRLY